MYGAYAFLRSASSVAPCHRMFGARLRRDFDGQGESEFSTFAFEFPPGVFPSILMFTMRITATKARISG